MSTVWNYRFNLFCFIHSTTTVLLHNFMKHTSLWEELLLRSVSKLQPINQRWYRGGEQICIGVCSLNVRAQFEFIYPTMSKKMLGDSPWSLSCIGRLYSSRVQHDPFMQLDVHSIFTRRSCTIVIVIKSVVLIVKFILDNYLEHRWIVIVIAVLPVPGWAHSLW